MIDIEVRGIPCVLDEGALDDFEMLELLARMVDGDVTALVGFARGIFGEEQLENIKDSLRDERGKVALTDMQAFVEEAINAAAKAKKAEPKN